MIVADMETWRLISGFLSEEAKIVRLELPFSGVPHSIDEMASDFQWPSPSLGVVVTIEEPDNEGFLSRTGNAELVVLGSQSIPDPSIDVPLNAVNPGDFVDLHCPSCNNDDLWIEGGRQAMDLIDLYMTNNGLSSSWRYAMKVIRCASCYETFLDHTPDGLIAFSTETC